MPGKVTIPLYDGDDFERMAELRRAINIAERKLAAARSEAAEAAPALRLGDEEPAATEDLKTDLAEARAEFATFVDEATERAEMWELHPIGHAEFRALLRDHPPRKVKETDAEGKEYEVTHPEDGDPFEVNTETFAKALLEFVDDEDADIRTVHAPFESLVGLKKRLKRLSSGEYDSMWIAAWQLNNGLVADPKATIFYDGARRSDET